MHDPTLAGTAPLSERRAPRAAATLVVVRDGEHGGIEVLLARRAASNDQNSGAWVFPGGVVDAGDRDAHACCRSLDDAAASARLGLSEHGLDHHISAVRECFEEVGLLFASRADDPSGALIRLDDDGASTQKLRAERAALHRRERGLAELCRDHGLQLAVDALVYLSHWLTPLGRPKRFDTRFFIAAAPRGQQASADGTEMLEQRWFRAADALAHGAELKLMTPTQKTLELVARFDDVAALLAWAAAPREITMILPRMGTGAQGLRPVAPDDYAWAEIGRLDPDGLGHACYDIQPGVAVRLSPRLLRVTANNGSVMTGPGTNTYLVGGGERNEWAAIDPGPLDERHVEAILAAAPGPIRWIFATHTHLDHSPAVLPLKARTGATVYGRRSPHTQWQDTSFAPDVELGGGERFELPGPGGGATTTLRAIHTPGHASNHFCYLLEEEKLLFTGDHVMQASTVVINPPDGDMAAYVASLRALIAGVGDDLEWLAPGHGFLMAQPKRAMQWIVEHRLKREAKVVAALRAHGPADADALLPRVYDDVRPQLHAVARRSLLAHLLKLRSDGAADEAQGVWALRA